MTDQYATIFTPDLEKFALSPTPPEPPADNHCRTCKFWSDKYTNALFRDCESEDVYYRVHGAGIMPVAEFGCIFHRAKETE